MATNLNAHKVIIEPAEGWVPIQLKELSNYREVLYFLIWRDIKVRYKQTILGAAWAVLQPLGIMVIFSIFFGALGNFGPKSGTYYPLWCFTGMVIWTFFATGLTQSANSLVSSVQLIKKVYFPRLLIPIAAVLAGILDFLIAFAVLVGMLLWHGKIPTGFALIEVPLYFCMSLITCLGLGIWLAALNAQFRDIRFTVPFLIQIWMFCCPLAYPIDIVPEQWRSVYTLNPMTGVIEGFRSALLGEPSLNAAMASVSAAVAILVLLAGVFYFRRVEENLADIV